VIIEASIGIAVSLDGEESADDLLRNADIAMYSAKGQGKGRYEMFETAMQVAVQQRLDWETDLRMAVERREFVLRYQPIVALATGKVVGLEALVRWQHPQRGLLTPPDFVPLAEETGLIEPLNRWVLHRACRRARRWQARYPDEPPLTISVNLSARLLRLPGLVNEVAQALREARLEPHRLVLEVSERALETDADALLPAVLDLKALGVRLALDNFGAGTASLRSLRRFPFDVVKIDAPFVGDVDRNPAQAELTQALLDMIRAMGLQTLAERVERSPQAERLRALGCDLAQGNHFSLPLSDDEVADMLRNGAVNGRSGVRLA
ncbi:MAG: GGDEF domain-containing phosphodiesterase, partial [Chloroflexi bacterium]|nr:GGDEF domain-containing phosphodiesterase [Chloroflexota bacterium]